MATESLAPDAFVTQTNLDGTIADIDEDPDSPDANWCNAIDEDADIVAHVSFPTPTGNLTTGADLQEFKIYIRKTAGGGTNPQCRIDLYENGSLVTSGTLTAVASETGELKSFTWDAVNLANIDGSGVEAYIFGDASGGKPADRRSVDVGAVEWNVTYTTQVIEWLTGMSNGAATVSGATKVAKKIAGTITCITSASGATSILRKIAGACAGVTSVTGLATATWALKGISSNIASVFGAVKVLKKITGAVAGVVSVAGSLTVTAGEILLAGVADGIASVSGIVKRTRIIAGLSMGLASVSGLTKITRGIAGAISGMASVSGVVKISRKLASIISGFGEIFGEIKVTHTLAGVVEAVATVAGVLGVLGEEVSKVFSSVQRILKRWWW